MDKNKPKQVPQEAPDPYSNIYEYAQDYSTILERMGHGVATADHLDETLAVIIPAGDLEEIIGASSHMAAVLGIEDGALTISFVAVGFNGAGGKPKVIDEHVNGGLPGQEVWPKVSLRDFAVLLPPPVIIKKSETAGKNS